MRVGMAQWIRALVAGVPAADRAGPARPGQGRRMPPTGNPGPADGERGPGGQFGVPVLRGRLRAARLRLYVTLASSIVGFVTMFQLRANAPGLEAPRLAGIDRRAGRRRRPGAGASWRIR